MVNDGFSFFSVPTVQLNTAAAMTQRSKRSNIMRKLLKRQDRNRDRRCANHTSLSLTFSVRFILNIAGETLKRMKADHPLSKDFFFFSVNVD